MHWAKRPSAVMICAAVAGCSAPTVGQRRNGPPGPRSSPSPRTKVAARVTNDSSTEDDSWRTVVT